MRSGAQTVRPHAGRGCRPPLSRVLDELEYLTGAERAVPNFGESSYATDDGAAVFERVVRGLGCPVAVAVGDRVWAETVVRLGRILGFGRIRSGSSLVNELRRVKSDQELETMAQAVDVVETRWPR
jgi:Xaa-Pro aminopeptidase